MFLYRITLVAFFAFYSLSLSASLFNANLERQRIQSNMEAKPGSAEEAYLQGVYALAEQDWKNARPKFQLALKREPRMARAYLGLAEIAHQKGNTYQAEQFLSRAYAIDKQDPYILISQGKFAYTNQDMSQAKQKFIAATRAQPDLTLAHVTLGDFYLNAKRDYKNAEIAYRKAIALTPNHGGAYYALGVSLLNQARYDESEQHLLKAAYLAPQMPLPLGMLGYQKFLQGDYSAALAHYESAIKIEAGYTPAYMGKQDVYVALAQQDKAIAELEKVLAIVPNHDQASFKLGMIYQSQGKPGVNKASHHYLNALKSNPNLAAAYNNLAWISLTHRNNPRQALRWAEQANEIAPDTPIFMDTLAWAHRAMGNRRNGIQLLKQAKQIAPLSPVSHYHLGVLYFESGQKSEAKAELELALAADAAFEGKQHAKEILRELN